MVHLLLILLGLIPAVLCLWYIYRKDVWEPEPKQQVVKVFIWGIVAIAPAFAVEYIFQYKIYRTTLEMMMTSIWLNMAICFCVIAPIEELFKYSAVKGCMYYHPDFNEKLDGVIYMVAGAMGFSALENIMYIFSIGFRDPTHAAYIGIMRGLLATPAHAIFSGFLGVFLGKAKFATTALGEIWLIVQGFLIAIFLHGLYDTIIFAGKPYNMGIIPLLLISGFILIREINKLANASPFKKSDQTPVQAQGQTTEQSHS